MASVKRDAVPSSVLSFGPDTGHVAWAGITPAATVTNHTVWTEPGRGDVDLLAAIATLPETFDGSLIVEVDVPEAGTNLISTQLSAQWITDRLGAEVF
jgi:inosose dehydratase